MPRVIGLVSAAEPGFEPRAHLLSRRLGVEVGTKLKSFWSWKRGGAQDVGSPPGGLAAGSEKNQRRWPS